MACNSCSTGKDGQPKGCKNNGTCGTDSCNKLTVFDWLSNMSLPNGQKPFDWVEVRFKNGRKHYYKNTENLSLSIGDIVATQAQAGHDSLCWNQMFCCDEKGCFLDGRNYRFIATKRPLLSAYCGHSLQTPNAAAAASIADIGLGRIYSERTKGTLNARLI